MSSEIFPIRISAFGCVCPLGFGVEATTKALRQGQSGIGPVTLFPTDGCRCRTAGEIPAGLRDAAVAVTPRAGHWSRAAQTVLLALAEALAARPDFQPDFVVVGTTSGGMTLGEEFFRRALEGRSLDSVMRRIRGYPPQAPVRDALRVLGVSAPVRIVSNACASGSNALGMAWRMVRTGQARRVVAGGYDVLSPLVFSGFDCLQVATPELCRPFDAARSGLALGEGAAFFLIEREGEFDFSGYGAATDTHHLTQPRPDGVGPATAMRRALAAAGWDPESVGHVNAHGTATPQNDACEAAALAAVCPGAPVVSTKAMTGHALGAAGAIEAAFCLMALRGQFHPPTLHFRSTDPGVDLDIVHGRAREGSFTRALSNSFGFGGANATVAFGRE